MSTRTGAAAPKEKKAVTYKDLRALKVAKSRKTLPRGLKVDFSLTVDSMTFRIPGQDEPVLKLSVASYVEAVLKADGFKLAD